MYLKDSVVYHNHIKSISQKLEKWVLDELACVGVFECGYTDYHINHNSYFCVSSNNPWRYEFLEKKFELLSAPFLEVGVNVLSKQSKIINYYRRNYRENCTKMSFVFPYREGFEMLVTSSIKPLNILEQRLVFNKFRQLSYEMGRIRKNKDFLHSEIDILDEVKQQHQRQRQHEDGLLDFKVAKKSQFDGIALTPKELVYIEHLMMNWTQKEIAYHHQVSETAVRKVIINIKRKLGQEFMAHSTMFRILKQKGVLIGLGYQLTSERFQD
tara:strand:- start:1599 stop:2405 length:807 start_codon:yes stop_codon:yes gene_type:complete